MCFIGFSHILCNNFNHCKLKKTCRVLSYSVICCHDLLVEFFVIDSASKVSKETGVVPAAASLSPGADPVYGSDFKHTPLKMLDCLGMTLSIEGERQ